MARNRPAGTASEPEHSQAQLAARGAVGVHGDADIPSWRSATTPQSRQRVNSLMLLAAAEWAGSVALILLLPVAALDRGWHATGVSAGLLVAAVAYVLGGLFAVDLFDQGRRVRAVQMLAINAALLTVLIGFLPGRVPTILILILRGAVYGLQIVSFRPLLHDAVVPEARARAVGRVMTASLVGAAVGALFAAAAVSGPELGAGNALLIVGVLALLVSLASLRLTDPGLGGVEPERLTTLFGGSRRLEALSTPIRAAVPRVLGVHTVRTSLTANVTAGALLYGLIHPWVVTVVSDADGEGDPISPGSAYLTLAAVLVVVGAVIALVAIGLEKSRRRSVTTLMRTAWLEPTVLGGIAAIALAFVAVPAALAVALGFALVGGALTKIALDVGTLSAVPWTDRPVAYALTNASWASGAILSAMLCSWGASSLPRTGFVILLILILLAVIVNRRIVQQPDADLDAALPIDMADVVAETPRDPETGLKSEVSPYAYVDAPAEVVDRTGQAPLLSVEKLSFAYGSVQVLFDVDLRVQAGELVALLGPNGVGKTTLLRNISGLETPQQGAVRFDGSDITRTAPARRVPMGLSQIVGGNAVFGTLSVAENLQMYGYSVTRDRESVREGIERAYDTFPKLADRRNQLGSTLSGGEQQMLGLSKALICKPKLLVIDEFSLGLAPVIVAELLSMVRELNAAGTAVLLVEQSVNVALNLVDHCYFMEKGSVIYDDTAQSLRAKPDLVQALSLGGLPPELAETHA